VDRGVSGPTLSQAQQEIITIEPRWETPTILFNRYKKNLASHEWNR
jgi:hypothetical protein